jgi:hypothetical protein
VQVYWTKLEQTIINEATVVCYSLRRSGMGTLVVVFLSIVGQLVMTIVFAKEAMTTKEGNPSRIKSTLASLFYLFMAVLLSWLLISQGILK